MSVVPNLAESPDRLERKLSTSANKLSTPAARKTIAHLFGGEDIVAKQKVDIDLVES